MLISASECEDGAEGILAFARPRSLRLAAGGAGAWASKKK